MDKLNNSIKVIYYIVDFYRTEGNPDYKIPNWDINKKKDSENIYELIDFYENYILNYNLYVYDMLSQELFQKLLKTKNQGKKGTNSKWHKLE